MTNKVYGLNRYKKNDRKAFAFGNFQWVLAGTLARSAQPNYVGPRDADHKLEPIDVRLLQDNKIVCVISANNCAMSDKGKELLKAAGIDFYNFKVKDRHAPTVEQLKEVANLIEAYRNRKQNYGATLVYCGYGQGRTGTFVAAWALMKHIAGQPGANVDELCTRTFLGGAFGVEESGQDLAIKAAVKGRRLSQVSMPPPPIVPGSSGAGSSRRPSAASFTGPFGADVPVFQPLSSFSGSSGSGSFRLTSAHDDNRSMSTFADFGGGSASSGS